MQLGNPVCIDFSSISIDLPTFPIEDIPSPFDILQKDYQQIEKRNYKVINNMATQLTTQTIPTYQMRLLFAMELERKQLKFSLMHPAIQSIPLGPDFKTLDLSINLADSPLPHVEAPKIGSTTRGIPTLSS